MLVRSVIIDRYHIPMMKTSSYFNEVLFYDPDPTIDQLFEKRTPQLFELKRSYVHLHIQSIHKNTWREQHTFGDVAKRGSLAPEDSSIESKANTQLGCSVDRLYYVPFPPPPLYNGLPGLQFQVITKSEELRTAVHAHDYEVGCLCLIGCRII